MEKVGLRGTLGKRWIETMVTELDWPKSSDNFIARGSDLFCKGAGRFKEFVKN